MYSAEELMNRPYYSPEMLMEITDTMLSYFRENEIGNISEYHFLTAVAHASDMCETIQNKRKEPFDLLPYEGIEEDIDTAMEIWRLRELFGGESSSEEPGVSYIELGGIKAFPVKNEKAQNQALKKTSCFYMFYFRNILNLMLGDKYTAEFIVDTIAIPMMESFSFSRLGVSFASKDAPDKKYYFDALKFGESIDTKDAGEIYFDFKDVLNSFGIPELAVPLSEKYDESRFKVYRDELIKYVPSGDDARVTVPEGIKAIGKSAFANLSGIEVIDLPESLEAIGGIAFGNMPDLREVNISHDLKKVGFNIFMDSKLQKECDTLYVLGNWLVFCGSDMEVIEIPENVTDIRDEAFYDLDKTAKKIILPPGLTEIQETTFGDFTELEAIDIPDSVDTLGRGAFEGCYALKSVRLSDNITELSECTFVDCHSLEELHLPKNLRSIGADGINVFAGCTSLKKIVFPEQLEYIGPCAFQDCTQLEEIVLPDSVKMIDDMAFAGCKNLKNVRLPEHEVEIAENAFEDTLWENNN